MTISYKLLALFGGTITTVGGGALLMNSSIFKNNPLPKSKTTIRDRLKKVGYTFNLDDTKWGSIRDAYNQLQNKDSVKFSSGTIDIRTLKDKCASYLSEDANDSKYDVSKRWCVEPKKISEFLTSINLNPLKTEGEDEAQGDKSKWEKLEIDYSENTKEKIPNWTFNAPKTGDTWKQLKEKCKGLFELRPWEDDYEVSIESTKLWCVSEAVTN